MLQLKAIEAAPLIEEAFAGDAVELAVLGDWEDVQVEFGLLPARVTPRPWYGLGAPPGMPHWRPPSWRDETPAAAPSKAAAKRKRKAAKASRQRNRRHKRK